MNPSKPEQCLPPEYTKNFFLKHEKHLFDLSKALTYENVVKDNIIPELEKSVETQKEHDEEKISSIFEEKNLDKLIIHFPLNISTEYTAVSKLSQPLKDEECPSKLLSAQMRLVSTESINDTLVYSSVSKDGSNLINYDVDFIPLQVLVDYFGFNIQVLQGRSWYDVKEKKYPTINLVLYCFSGREHIFKLFRRHTLEEVKLKRKQGGVGLEHILKKVKDGLIDDSKFVSAR